MTAFVGIYTQFWTSILISTFLICNSNFFGILSTGVYWRTHLCIDVNNIVLIQERMIDDRKADVPIKNIYEKLGLWKETVIHLPLLMAATRSIFFGPLRRENHNFFLVCFAVITQVFFSPLFSLFNLTPRVILHHYSPTPWTWRRFQVCIWSFSSNSSYKPNDRNAKNVRQSLTPSPQSSQHRMERKQRGSRVGTPPPLPFLFLPICPCASPTCFLR